MFNSHDIRCLIFILLSGWQVLASGAVAEEKRLDVSRIDMANSVSLTEYFGVLEDPGARLTLDEVRSLDQAGRFKGDQPRAAALSFDFTRSAFWLRLRMHNSSDQPLERLFEIGHAQLTHVQFHQPGSDGTYQLVTTGSGAPFATRAYPHRYFVFPIRLPAHSDQVFYLRIQSTDALLVPARLWEIPAFRAYERSDYLGQAWYFGMATAMVLFNLLLYIALRDVIYVLYVSFVANIAFALAARSGLAQEFLWPQAMLWADSAHFVGYSFSLAALLFFARRMLTTATLLPRLDRPLKLLAGLLLLTPIGFLISLQSVAKAAALLYLATTILILGVGLFGAFKRQRSAYFFVAAFATLMLGAAITALRSLGVLPTNLLTINGLQLGSALEMILLAFALADRFNEIRGEKDKAQIETLQAEHRLVETLRSSERLLEGRVSERTAQLSVTIDRLKQTQAELVQAEKLASLGALVAGVAHELNTPIGNALMMTTSLESAADEFEALIAGGALRRSEAIAYAKRTRDMAQIASRSCTRAAALVTSFKQIAVDQASEERRSFDLHTLIDDNIRALRFSIGPMPWVLEADIPTGIECESYTGALGQVLANLVQNAVVHAFEGRTNGAIRVTARVSTDYVDLMVSDDGKGMESAVLARVFEPFYTTRFGQGGSGLGLSIALNIATGILGGTLSATSVPGQGSRFTLRFPRVVRERVAGLDRMALQR